jgi:hypothetical protein
MDTWTEQRLIGLVKAMRHLPPETSIHKHKHILAQEILTELLRLDDETDPIGWIADKNKRLAARVLFWTGLSYFRDTFLGVKLARQAGQSTSGPIQQWFDSLPNFTEGQIETLFEPLLDTNPLTVTEDTLNTIFQRLQNLYTGYDEVNNVSSGNDLFDFVSGLLSIGVGTNPLQYIEINYQHLASVQMLRYLVTELQMPYSLWELKPLKIYKPKLRLDVESIAVALREVALYQLGFKLTLSAHIPRRLIPQSPAFRYISWEGVESISDSRGFSYLVWYRLPQGKGLSWRYNQTLQLLCYPALVPSVAEITLQSTQTKMVFLGSSTEDHQLKVLKTLELGDLIWDFRLAIPARR